MAKRKPRRFVVKLAAKQRKRPMQELYHGTSASAAKKIMKQGVRVPGGGDFSFFTQDKKDAAGYARSRGKSGVVFKFAVPKKFFNRRFDSSYDRGIGASLDDVITRRTIPANWIKGVMNAKGRVMKSWVTRRQRYGASGRGAGKGKRTKGRKR